MSATPPRTTPVVRPGVPSLIAPTDNPPLRAVVVRFLWGRNQPLVGLLPLPQGSPSLYRPTDLPTLRQVLSDLDLVVGFRPRALFERLDLDPGPCRLVDLGRVGETSGTLAMPGPRAAVRMLTGQGLHPDGLLLRKARDAASAGFPRLMREDLGALRTYYRFGVLHGWVPLRRRLKEHRVPVRWRAEDEPGLGELLDRALADGLALELLTTPPEDPARPFQRCQRVIPEETWDGVLDFREPARVQVRRLPLEVILDARLAPMPSGSVRFAPEVRRNHRARRLVSRAWDTRPGEDRQRLVARALEVDPECLDALVLKALDLPDVERRLEALEQAVEVGQRQTGHLVEVAAGRLWQVLEARPFLRVCHALMFEFHAAGRLDRALEMARSLLGLDEADELGVRYPFWSWLLEAGRDWEALRSLRDFAGESTAMYLYARALAEFRVRGVDDARPWVRRALEANPPFAEFLRDPEALPGWDVDGFSPGSTEEALALWRLFGPSWRAGGAVAVQRLL